MYACVTMGIFVWVYEQISRDQTLMSLCTVPRQWYLFTRPCYALYLIDIFILIMLLHAVVLTGAVHTICMEDPSVHEGNREPLVGPYKDI